jgi:hypothetical protein
LLSAGSAASGRTRRNTAIDTPLQRQRQGDLLLGLARLVNSNRLALIVLAANVAELGSRAREAAAESAPGRWAARNARAVRLFLLSLLALCDATQPAGYRAIAAARRPFRRHRAPRLLPRRLDRRAVCRADRAACRARARPRFVVSLG